MPMLCKAHGRPFAWPHAVGCTQCCSDYADNADPYMAPNGGYADGPLDFTDHGSARARRRMARAGRHA